MSEMKKYLFSQYATGRANTTDGYNFSRTSDRGSYITDWMRGNTRASHIQGERPTVEVHSNMSEHGLAHFVLCSSRYVENDYEMKNGVLEKRPTRPYAYSHYLVLPAPEDAEQADQHAKTALETLLCVRRFLDPWEFQQIAKQENPAPFNNLEISTDEIQECWQKTFTDKGSSLKMNGDILAIFLARFWEACWLRLVGDLKTPLLVVATSAERNFNTQANAVIPDGILFFHDYVLPHLPEAVRQIISVSFGCIGEQSAAQPGTACMVCYPEATTLSMDGVYLAYCNKFSDDAADSIHLTIGLNMLKGTMPSYYRNLYTLENGREIAQDFDYISLTTEFDLMLKDIESDSITDEQRMKFLAQCNAALSKVRQVLKEYQLSDAQITKVLFDLEMKLAELNSLYVKDYQQNLYKIWLDFYSSLKDRTGLLTQEESKALSAVWYKALTQKFNPLDWESFPFLDLSNLQANADNEELEKAILENGQKFNKKFTETDKATLYQLLAYQQKYRYDEKNLLATGLQRFILEHSENNEALLNPITYLQNLDMLKALSSENRQYFMNDFSLLMKRHYEIRKLNPIQSVEEAMCEMDWQNEVCLRAKESILHTTSAEFTVCAIDSELLLPEWYVSAPHSFHMGLYRRLLGKAIDLNDRNDQLDEEAKTQLEQAYRQCIEHHYADIWFNNCPLAAVLEHPWEETVAWENTIVQQALEEEGAPCEAERVVDRLIKLRQSSKDETANAYLQILLNKYSEHTNILNAYLEKTGSLLSVESGCVLAFRSDVLSIIQKIPKEEGYWPYQTVQTLSNWFALYKGHENETLTQQVEQLFVLSLQNAISHRSSQENLVQLYCAKAKLHQNNNQEFLEQLFEQLEDRELDNLLICKEPLEALRQYSIYDESIMLRLRKVLNNSIENKRKIALKPNDISYIIQFGKLVGLKPVTKEVCSILVDTLEYRLDQKTLEELCDYAKMHHESLDELIEVMMQRAKLADADSPEQRIIDLIEMLNRCQNAEDRKARTIQQITQTLLPALPKNKVPGDALMNALLPAVTDAYRFQSRVKVEVMDWLEELNVSSLYSQMERTVQALNISRTDVPSSRSKWSVFFFEYSAHVLCKEIRDQQYALGQMLSLANEQNDVIHAVNEQHRLVSGLSDAAGEVKRIGDYISQECRMAIQQDKSLQDADELSRVIRQVNSSKKTDDFFTGCLVNEAYQYIGMLLKEDVYFHNIANNVMAIRELKDCFSELREYKDKSLLEKERAVNNACRLFDFYEAAEREQNVSSMDLMQMLRSFDQTEWDAVSGICMEYGNEKLQNCSDEIQAIPYLVDSIDTAGTPPRFNWERFLNQAFPLENKDWKNANIWTDDGNLYGILCLLLQWLSQDGLQNIKSAFVAFLNASNIGRNARSKKWTRKIRAHYDEQMKNSMLDWLLQ